MSEKCATLSGGSWKTDRLEEEQKGWPSLRRRLNTLKEEKRRRANAPPCIPSDRARLQDTCRRDSFSTLLRTLRACGDALLLPHTPRVDHHLSIIVKHFSKRIPRIIFVSDVVPRFSPSSRHLERGSTGLECVQKGESDDAQIVLVLLRFVLRPYRSLRISTVTTRCRKRLPSVQERNFGGLF